ncbi:MAG: HNH endonuclease [Patescibacteria group bacterium]|nr:HNH endonuclease [Patescibacteria group bacterium]
MTKQNYEDYWKLTVEYTDINDDKFIGTLQTIVDFINKNDTSQYSSKMYKQLQEVVYKKYPKKDMGSVRKSINQFVKLGFINYELKTYNDSTIEFLEARTKRKRKSIFSKIVYSNSSFNSSVTEYSNQKEINFLLKTLEEIGKLDKKDVVGLMTVNIPSIKKGFLEKDEIKIVREKAEKISFIKRKYNQVGYLWNFLKKLDDLVIINNELYFEEDAQVIFGEELKIGVKTRDAYLHRIYKNLLKNETDEKIGDIKCMLEKLSYPSLVASHIKPFIKSKDDEAYDPNNGLLLSRNMDMLFDQGYISFKNNGQIIFSRQLKTDVIKYLKSYRLDEIFINNKRLQYFDYHRKNILRIQ